MAYKCIEATLVPQAIADTSTTQKNPLGTIVRASDPTYGIGEFIYLKGVASTAIGSVVTYAYNFATTLADGSSKDPVAVAMSACVASSFGWYQIFGISVVKAATVVPAADVYTTATAGTVDDAVVAGDRIKNARFGTADGTPAAGFALVAMQRPFSDNGTAA